MRAFLFIGGEYPHKREFISEYRHGDFIACADSGLDAAMAWGLAPQLVVGDMDSVSGESALSGLGGAEVIRLPRAKDDTDTEAALDELWRRGYAEVCLVGGGGGRLDHFLAIASLFDRDSCPRSWLCSEDRAAVLVGKAEFECRAGSIVSVFPTGPETLRMRSWGLRWPLDGLSFLRGSFGVSNEATERNVRLEVLSGRALIVRPYPDRSLGRPERGQTLP